MNKNSTNFYSKCLFTIADCYANGKVITKNDEEAPKFNQLSAKYDNSEALLVLRKIYENGKLKTQVDNSIIKKQHNKITQKHYSLL